MAVHSPRILVVEDDAVIRSALEVALRGEGYQVRAEADGTDLDDVAEQFRPDLALLDVRLPVGPDGYSMAARLRRGSDLPLLFLTAADTVDDRLAGFRAGADDYLVKPFSMAELLAGSRRCSGDPGASRQTPGRWATSSSTTAPERSCAAASPSS